MPVVIELERFMIAGNILEKPGKQPEIPGNILEFPEKPPEFPGKIINAIFMKKRQNLYKKLI